MLLGIFALAAVQTLPITQIPSAAHWGDALVLRVQPKTGTVCTFAHRKLSFIALDDKTFLTVIPAPHPESAPLETTFQITMRCLPTGTSAGPQSWARFPLKITRASLPVAHLRLPHHQVHWDPEAQSRIDQEMAAAKARVDWRFPTLIHTAAELGAIEAPVKGPMTAPFNSPRILNDARPTHHTGVDLAAMEGTPVRSPLDGVVVLVQDAFLGGNMLYVHHGLALVTAFAHLSNLSVKEGEWVKRGQTLGLSGQTGRATGPHVHWEAFWFGQRFNALSLIDLLKKPQKIQRVQLTLPLELGSVKVAN